MLTFPVFTYLYGKASGKLIATLKENKESDEHLSRLVFETDTEEYQCYVNAQKLPQGQLALIDGNIVEDGLPRGAELVIYEYGRKGDKFSNLRVKTILAIENGSTVKQCWYRPHTGRRLIPEKGEVHAVMGRYLVLIPRGHTALGFRIKPRSLAHQYTAIEATKNSVVFRTIVK